MTTEQIRKTGAMALRMLRNGTPGKLGTELPAATGKLAEKLA